MKKKEEKVLDKKGNEVIKTTERMTVYGLKSTSTGIKKGKAYKLHPITAKGLLDQKVVSTTEPTEEK